MSTASTDRLTRLARRGGGAGAAFGRLLGRYWLSAVIVAGFLVTWEAYVRIFAVPNYVLASVTGILHALYIERDTLMTQTGVTLQEIVPGLVLGIAAGLILAIVMSYSGTVERGLYPIVIASQAVPVPTIAAPLVIALGYNIWPKLVVIVLIVFFPIAVNTFEGLTSVDPELLNLMRTMSASRWKVFRHVRFPAALPLFFTGVKLAAIYSVIGAVFGEWVGSDQGLGAYILQQNGTLRTDREFAAIFILSVLGILLFILAGVVAFLCTPWRHRATK